MGSCTALTLLQQMGARNYSCWSTLLRILLCKAVIFIGVCMNYEEGVLFLIYWKYNKMIPIKTEAAETVVKKIWNL